MCGSANSEMAINAQKMKLQLQIQYRLKREADWNLLTVNPKQALFEAKDCKQISCIDLLVAVFTRN